MKNPSGWTGILVWLYFFIPVAPVYSETLPFQLLHHKKGDTAEAYGRSVAGVGDMNGDGKDDFIVGNHRASPNGLSEAGSVYVYSGQDGALIHQVNGDTNGEWLGYAVAGAGDVNGDGTPDFIVGAPQANAGLLLEAGKVTVYSGLTANPLCEIFGAGSSDHLGTSIGKIADLDGDGKNDFIVGAPGTNANSRINSGSAFVCSGAACNPLFRVDGAATSDFLGASVAGAGDVNGDGKSDFIVGAPLADPGGDLGVNSGAAYLHSGLDGTRLFTLRGDSIDDYLGYSVAGAGDINGDGRGDIIIGAYGKDVGGRSDVGWAGVFSGGDSSLVFQFVGDSARSLFGWSVAGAGDVNGDGRGDFVVGAVNARPGGVRGAGSAYVYSGMDGALLFRADGVESPDEMGYSVAGAGDVNGDGRTDFVASALLADSGKGAVFVFGLLATGAPVEIYNRPNRFELWQNYPNPFNPATVIRYSLNKREKVTLEIFNLAGQRVRVLAEGEQAAGEHTALWEGTDNQGKTLPSGIYFYRLKGKDFSETKKMIFLK